MRRLALLVALSACGGVKGPRQVQTSFGAFDVGPSGYEHVGEEVRVLALDSGLPCLDMSFDVELPATTSYIQLQLKGPVGDLTGVSCGVARKGPCEAFLSVGVPGERPLVHQGLAGTVRVLQDSPTAGLVVEIDAVVSKPALDPQDKTTDSVQGETLKLTISPTSCL